MEKFLYLLSVGIGVGCIYGLVALGLSIVYQTSRVVNIAQGTFFMLGAVLASVFLVGLDMPYGWGAVLAVIGTVIVATVVLNWGMISPLLEHGSPHMTVVLGTYAVATLIDISAGKLTNFAYLRVPAILSMRSIKLGIFPIVGQYGAVMLATVILVAAYWYFVNYTHIGWAYRAVGLDRDMAKLLGISAGGMVALAVAIAAVIGAITGLLAGPLTSVTASMGLNYTIKGFIGSIIGGIDNPLTATAGGVLLGVIYMLIAGYFSPGYAELLTFVILLFVLIARPHGIFALK